MTMSQGFFLFFKFVFSSVITRLLSSLETKTPAVRAWVNYFHCSMPEHHFPRGIIQTSNTLWTSWLTCKHPFLM
ncbi:hypothetical protein B0I35DRAFT_420380 [Stachybotrys elegans]|uniref:Secreted protein n=1 Tax=Stachybotrys elegans TaxID=80388 RepID=A0A8K0WYH9_9HYPO|nr:hypothetical protein B0I35DRAFT_420380 [Stachybotrys elegans]